MAEESINKPVMFMGRDLRKIPCFRKTFLYGIGGGLGSGLLVFLFTSRVSLATDVTVFSFIAIGSVYWCTCRYKLAVKRFEINRYKTEFIKDVPADGPIETKIIK